MYITFSYLFTCICQVFFNNEHEFKNVSETEAGTEELHTSAGQRTFEHWSSCLRKDIEWICKSFRDKNAFHLSAGGWKWFGLRWVEGCQLSLSFYAVGAGCEPACRCVGQWQSGRSRDHGVWDSALPSLNIWPGQGLDFLTLPPQLQMGIIISHLIVVRISNYTQYMRVANTVVITQI